MEKVDSAGERDRGDAPGSRGTPSIVGWSSKDTHACEPQHGSAHSRTTRSGESDASANSGHHAEARATTATDPARCLVQVRSADAGAISGLHGRESDAADAYIPALSRRLQKAQGRVVAPADSARALSSLNVSPPSPGHSNAPSECHRSAYDAAPRIGDQSAEAETPSPPPHERGFVVESHHKRLD